jgi:hypothetical protein
MNATQFDRDLMRLVSKAVPVAAPLVSGKKPDEDLAATMVEQLALHLGSVIAATSGGDPKVIDRVLEAATQKVFEAASHHNQALCKLADAGLIKKQKGAA